MYLGRIKCEPCKDSCQSESCKAILAFHLRYLQDLDVIFLVGQNLAGFVSWTLDLLARVLTFAIFLIISVIKIMIIVVFPTDQ